MNYIVGKIFSLKMSNPLRIFFDNLIESNWIQTKTQINAISHIEGLECNSTSPSDQWLLHLKTDEGAKTGFLKLFITSTSLVKNADAKKATNALNYESKIYEHVLPLIKCAFFPAVYEIKKNLHFADILGLIQNKVKNNTCRRKLSNNEISKNLVRNCKYMIEYKDNRPSLSSIRGIFDEKGDNLNENEDLLLQKKIRFGYFIIEGFPKSSKSLYNMLIKRHLTRNMLEFWKVVLQITRGLHLMHNIKLIHNDLHYENIRICKEHTSTIVKINGTIVSIESQYRAIIFDFDRSYTKRLGPNKINDKYFKEIHGIQNKFSAYYDIFYLFCCLSALIKSDYLITLLSKDQKILNIYHDFLQKKEGFKINKIVVSRLCRPFDEIEASLVHEIVKRERGSSKKKMMDNLKK